MCGFFNVLSVSLSIVLMVSFFFFFKQKTAYEMRISDWSSDVCSSDLRGRSHGHRVGADPGIGARALGGGEGLLEQAIELPAQSAGTARDGPGLLHLAQALRFAQDQRIQPGGHPEPVAPGVGVIVTAEIGAEAPTGAGAVPRVVGEDGLERGPPV